MSGEDTGWGGPKIRLAKRIAKVSKARIVKKAYAGKKPAKKVAKKVTKKVSVKKVAAAAKKSKASLRKVVRGRA